MPMEAQEFAGEHLRYMTVHPDGYDPNRKYPMVIMLHGFGASMEDLAGLSPVIDSRGYVYAFPNGPEALELAPGYVGYSWTHPDRRRDAEEDAKSGEKLRGFFGEVMAQYGVEPGNAALGGFSQGGRLAYLNGLSRPDLFAGVVALGAAMFDTEPLRAMLPAERTQPVFVGHGEYDPQISVEQARMMRGFLEAEGYSPAYNEYPIGHEISRQLVGDLSAWLRRVLPPASSS